MTSTAIACKTYVNRQEPSLRAEHRSSNRGGGVVANAKQWHRCHRNGVHPTNDHDVHRRRQLDASVQIDRMRNGKPSLESHDRECEDGQVTGKDCEKPSHLTPNTVLPIEGVVEVFSHRVCINRSYQE
uniref:Uncharacterized protein n=1 Tax=Anopheles culicifacies TaxID=139723 RepID=A0A182MEL8_9DIPT